MHGLLQKKFYDGSTVDHDGFAIYRRRDIGSFIDIKGVCLDNRSIGLYNKNLIMKFQVHINVEIYNQLRSIKYLFKYVNKGLDKAIAIIKGNHSASGGKSRKCTPLDEIKTYLDCR